MRFSFYSLLFVIFFILSRSITTQAQMEYSLAPVLGFGMANHPHKTLSEFTISTTKTDVISGPSYLLGIKQGLQVNERLSFEMEASLQQSHFDIREERNINNLFFLVSVRNFSGHRFKLNSLNIPLVVRYSIPDQRGAFSFSTGIALRQEKNSKVYYYEEITDTFLESTTLSEAEIENNNSVGSSYDFSDFEMEKVNRYYWVLGLGRQIGENFFIDLEYFHPLQENSIEYFFVDLESIFPSRPTELSYRKVNFKDPTLHLKVGYWIR